MGRSFLVTFIYGLHSISARRPLWEALTGLAGVSAYPWLVLGDFNALLTPQDKEGGMPISHYETFDFTMALQHCDLVDLCSMGCWLTWANGAVSSKLDRALVNTQWLLEDYHNYAKNPPAGLPLRPFLLYCIAAARGLARISTFQVS